MSESTRNPDRQRSSKAPLFALIAVLAIAAIAVYFIFVRERPEPEIKLALVTWTEDPFWDPLVRGAQDCADASNVKLTIVKSKPTVEAQNQHIKELMSASLDGIAISPNDAAAQADVLNDAANKMPLVTFDSDAPDSKRRRFVGIDNYAAGHMCADEIREALPDGGPILISVGSTTVSHGRERRQGLIDGLLERGFKPDRAADPLDAPLKGSKYTIVATVTDGADPAKAVTAIADALKAHPDVKGIVGLFSYSAPAALQAMQQTGTSGIQLVGFDDADETQAGLESGTIHSSILQDTYRAGYEAIEVLKDEVRGIQRGPAEQSPILNVRINVLSKDNLAAMRDAKLIRQPKNAAGGATTQPTS